MAEKDTKKRYSGLNIQLTVEGISIDVQNIVFEKLSRIIPEHSHGENCYEIHYIASGSGQLRADGKLYEIRPDSLYVTGPHVEHAQSSNPGDPMEEYCVYLKLRHAVTDRTKSPLLGAFSDVRFWFGQDTQHISELFGKLFGELEQQQTGCRNMAAALLYQLIICMVRNYDQPDRLNASSSADRQADNRALMIEEYFLYEYRDLSLEVLSEKLALSPRQTQRLLQKYYGKTFHQKKKEARMSAAMVLLENPGLSISDIANLLGYSSLEHFSSAFHLYFQYSPREFRKVSRSGYPLSL